MSANNKNDTSYVNQTSTPSNKIVSPKLNIDIDELKLRSMLTSTDELEIDIKVKNDLLKLRLCNEGCLNNFLEKTVSSSELICLRSCMGKLNEVEKVISKFLSTKSTH